MAQPTRRQKLEMLRGQLDSERSSFMTHWRDLGDHIFPRRPRFSVSDANRGDRRNQKIIDSTGTMAARTLRSGMMSGVTSPARPWFRLATPDPGLNEFGKVKDWLHKVGQIMSTSFLRSNLYNVLPIVYGDIGTFATGAMSIEEDFEDVTRHYSFPIGSYMIANNDKLKVDVFFREFRMTVRQLVQRFGKKKANGDVDWSVFSSHVRSQFEAGSYETWIDVCHVIQPNENFNPAQLASKFKKYESVYYEAGSTPGSNGASYLRTEDDSKLLSEKGYDFFPILCPRWEVTGEDVYGTDCPGMIALGDVKALQLMHKRKAQGIEKMINPPMVGPSSMRNSKASILPGDITYLDTREGQQGFRAAHDVNLRLDGLMMDIEAHQKRVQRAFFEDLFLMLASSDRRDFTAREIEERHEEKLLALGPVLEQLNQDLLDPLIDNAFDIHFRQGLLPPPPEELQGMKLKVEYISVMAQAQKLVGMAGIERFTGFVGQVAGMNPEIMDKVNADQIIDVYGDITSIPPGIVRSDEEVDAMRASRAQAAQAQAKMEAIQSVSASAKDLAAADMSGDNALTKMIGAGTGA